MMKRLIFASVIALLIIGLPLSASTRWPQAVAKRPMGKVMGTLLDVQGARVTNAVVKIESAKFKWEGISDDEGDFMAEVPADTYRIYVEANGFRKFESAFLKVKPKIIEMVNIHLEVMAIVNPIKIAPE